MTTGVVCKVKRMAKVVVNEVTVAVHAQYVFHYFSQCTQPVQVALLQVSNRANLLFYRLTGRNLSVGG